MTTSRSLSLSPGPGPLGVTSTVTVAQHWLPLALRIATAWWQTETGRQLVSGPGLVIMSLPTVTVLLGPSPPARGPAWHCRPGRQIENLCLKQYQGTDSV
jgi:hypothetical protein